MYIFNLGDSIGLIYLRDGTYVRTRPHNFFRFDEAVRVAKAERISHGRIAGSLMGTRAFGDFHAKRKSDHRCVFSQQAVYTSHFCFYDGKHYLKHLYGEH